MLLLVLLMVEMDKTFATVRHQNAKTINVEVTTKPSVDVGRVWVQFRR